MNVYHENKETRAHERWPTAQIVPKLELWNQQKPGYGCGIFSSVSGEQPSVHEGLFYRQNGKGGNSNGIIFRLLAGGVFFE